MVTKDKQWWTFEVLGPSMIYNRFNGEISCHHVTASLHHHVTMSLCQSVICLAPWHQTSQSFALPPATKPVSYLPCPLPQCHHVTTPLHHCITASPCHCVSQSFALPPATKSVSHLPCPLPPNQSVICLAPYHHVTVPLHHHVTASPHHCISQSFALPPATKPVSHLPCPLPPNQSVICLAPYHHITMPPCHHVTTLVSHLPCPLPPNQWVICLAPYHHVTVPPHHHVTASPHHHISQSFALPPATKPVSHLPCPLPPNQSVICLAPYHRITMPPCHHVTTLVSHLPCPLPPNQSVICLAPCHQISQSFALPLPQHHHVTASPCHHVTMSPH